MSQMPNYPYEAAIHHTHIYAEVCTSACPANPWFEKKELGDALLGLVAEWQSHGNTRPDGDPAAAQIAECARQLLQVIDANGPGL